MDEMQELQAAITEMGAKFDEFLARQNAEIMDLINEAIRADDAEEAIDLKKMKEEVVAIMNRIPPKFESSNN